MPSKYPRHLKIHLCRISSVYQGNALALHWLWLFTALPQFLWLPSTGSASFLMSAASQVHMCTSGPQLEPLSVGKPPGLSAPVPASHQGMLKFKGLFTHPAEVAKPLKKQVKNPEDTKVTTPLLPPTRQQPLSASNRANLFKVTS